ncbi:MAG: hypothetical protein AB1374_07600 [Bacillota bacterium]
MRNHDLVDMSALQLLTEELRVNAGLAALDLHRQPWVHVDRFESKRAAEWLVERLTAICREKKRRRLEGGS